MTASRRFLRGASVLALLLLEGPFLWGTPPQDRKLPVPLPAEQSRLQTEVKGLYKEDFSRKDRESKRALVQKLLAQASDAANSPASRYVLLSLGRDLSVEALDLTSAFALIDELERSFELLAPPLAGASFSVTANALKAQALSTAQKFVASAEDSAGISAAYLIIAEASVVARTFEDALSAAQLAERYAKAAKLQGIQDRAALLVKEIPDLRREEEAFAAAITTKADDPGARLVKGRYVLFVVGDEKSGIETLAECSDPAIQRAAKLEKALGTDADSRLEIAEAWLLLADKEQTPLHKRRYQRRGSLWLDRALEGAGGLVKLKIERRIEELRAKTTGSGSVDLVQWVDIKKDAPGGAWAKNGGTLEMPLQGEDFETLTFPFVAPPEFDLAVTVEKKGDSVIDFLLGCGNIIVALDNDERNSAIRLGDKEIATCEAVIAPKKPTPVLISVRLTGLTVKVEGKTVMDWKGDYRRSGEGDAKGRPLAPVSMRSMGGWRLTRMVLVPVSGQGRKLR
jgi:hypothetical protein